MWIIGKRRRQPEIDRRRVGGSLAHNSNVLANHPALFFPTFRLPLNRPIFCQSRCFAAYHEQGKGLFILGLRDGFCARKQTMQGANRSKVEHLARIGNAAETFFWCKIRRNTQYKEPRYPCTPCSDHHFSHDFRLPKWSVGGSPTRLPTSAT